MSYVFVPRAVLKMACNVTGWRSADNSVPSRPAYRSWLFSWSTSYSFLPIAFRLPEQKPQQRTKSWRTFSVCPHFCQPACCTPYSVPGSENGRPVKCLVGRVNRNYSLKLIEIYLPTVKHNTKSKKQSLLNFVAARVELPGMSLLFNVKQNTIKIRTLLTVNRNLQKNTQQPATTNRVYAALAKSNKIL